jgi:hypothetical protein
MTDDNRAVGDREQEPAQLGTCHLADVTGPLAQFWVDMDFLH